MTSPNVRKGAYVVIIAAQINLQDEAHLFALLSGLSENQKNLLTYEFEKLKTRGHLDATTRRDSSAGQGNTSLRKLVDQMRNLDALPAPWRS